MMRLRSISIRWLSPKGNLTVNDNWQSKEFLVGEQTGRAGDFFLFMKAPYFNAK